LKFKFLHNCEVRYLCDIMVMTQKLLGSKSQGVVTGNYKQQRVAGVKNRRCVLSVKATAAAEETFT